MDNDGGFKDERATSPENHPGSSSSMSLARATLCPFPKSIKQRQRHDAATL